MPSPARKSDARYLNEKIAHGRHERHTLEKFPSDAAPDDWVSKSFQFYELTKSVLASRVRVNLKFDQLILECYSADEGPNSGWVHVSLLPPGYGRNRKQLLSYVKDPDTGKFAYVPGLVETP